MIDREKIIEKLEREVKRTYGIKSAIWKYGENGYEKVSEEITEHREPFVTLTIEIADKILALLKEQDAMEPKWTNVKERYPEEEGFYLVSADHGNYHPWIAEMRIFKGIKGFCNMSTMPCVGAWMPLPEPYKEGR